MLDFKKYHVMVSSKKKMEYPNYYIIDYEGGVRTNKNDHILQHTFKFKHINGDKYRVYICSDNYINAIKVIAEQIAPNNVNVSDISKNRCKIVYEGVYNPSDMAFGQGLYHTLDKRQPFTHYQRAHPFHWKLKSVQLLTK